MTRRARRRDEWTLAGSLFNIDLDVYSLEPLDVIGDALAGKVLSPIPSLDAGLRAWTKLIKALPRAAKTAWKRAKRRELNIGLGSQFRSAVDEMSVKPSTLKEITRLGATIAVTLYPIEIRRKSPTRKSGT